MKYKNYLLILIIGLFYQVVTHSQLPWLSFGDYQNITLTVNAGSQFSLPVFLHSTDVEIVSIDYVLKSSEEASGLFHIINREIPVSTALNDPVFSAIEVSSVEPTDTSKLSPINGQNVNPSGIDLGATASDTAFGSNSSGIVSIFSLGINPNTPHGTYSISTANLYPDSQTGWMGGNNIEGKFNSHGFVIINVIPETSTYTLISALALLFIPIRKFLS